MLYQVFSNLIGNAVRYAGETGGFVEVGGERQGERVRFFVRDHGPGIPVEERQKIFELFHRGSTGKGTHGTGVGLAIVRKIAQLARGKAWVEETPGGGSTFWVEFRDSPQAAGKAR
jgi:signal transduction histidine kinase